MRKQLHQMRLYIVLAIVAMLGFSATAMAQGIIEEKLRPEDGSAVPQGDVDKPRSRIASKKEDIPGGVQERILENVQSPKDWFFKPYKDTNTDYDGKVAYIVKSPGYVGYYLYPGNKGAKNWVGLELNRQKAEDAGNWPLRAKGNLYQLVSGEDGIQISQVEKHWQAKASRPEFDLSLDEVVDPEMEVQPWIICTGDGTESVVNILASIQGPGIEANSVVWSDPSVKMNDTVVPATVIEHSEDEKKADIAFESAVATGTYDVGVTASASIGGSRSSQTASAPLTIVGPGDITASPQGVVQLDNPGNADAVFFATPLADNVSASSVL